MSFFNEQEISINLKTHMEKRPLIVKVSWGTIVPDLKLYHTAIAGTKKYIFKQIGQKQRTRNKGICESTSCPFLIYIFIWQWVPICLKRIKNAPWRKDSLFHTWCLQHWISIFRKMLIRFPSFIYQKSVQNWSTI